MSDNGRLGRSADPTRSQLHHTEPLAWLVPSVTTRLRANALYIQSPRLQTAPIMPHCPEDPSTRNPEVAAAARALERA